MKQTSPTTNIKIRIKTPSGEASKAAKGLKPFIIGLNKCTTYTNKEDNTIYWELNTPLRRAIKIRTNVYRYEQIINAILNNKYMKKLEHKHLTEEGKKELRRMLQGQTKVTIVLKEEQENIIEGKTLWERIKETFTRS